MKPLISESEIRSGVDQMARRIADDYRDRPVTILGVLTGSIIFLSDLIRKIDLPIRVGLIQASSYQGRSTEPGELRINDELVPDIRGRDVLLVDDIFDTGHTMTALFETIGEKKPNSIRSVVLLWKEQRRRVELEPNYACFRIPDLFVVGYGLDYNDEYRHLPHIAALDESDL